jgi:hypothetical protein
MLLLLEVHPIQNFWTRTRRAPPIGTSHSVLSRKNFRENPDFNRITVRFVQMNHPYFDMCNQLLLDDKH